MEIEITDLALHKIGIDLVESLKDKLGKNTLLNPHPNVEIDPKHTHGKHKGHLQISITYKIVGGEIHIFMEDYAKYMEYGLAHNVSPEELLAWVNDKILANYKGKAKNREATKRKIAERLAKHISVYGPRPFPFIRTTLHNDFPKILKTVLDGAKAEPK